MMGYASVELSLISMKIRGSWNGRCQWLCLTIRDRMGMIISISHRVHGVIRVFWFMDPLSWYCANCSWLQEVTNTVGASARHVHATHEETEIVKAAKPALSMKFLGTSGLGICVRDWLLCLTMSPQINRENVEWASLEFQAKLLHIWLHCSRRFIW